MHVEQIEAIRLLVERLHETREALKACLEVLCDEFSLPEDSKIQWGPDTTIGRAHSVITRARDALKD